MLQISFYITTISKGIEIIHFSHFHFIETLAHDEHYLAVTACKIQWTVMIVTALIIRFHVILPMYDHVEV